MTAAALSARASPPQLFDYRPEGARLQQLGRARMDAPRAHAREERREHSHSGAIWRRHCTIFCTPVARVRRRLPVISSIECACIYRTSPRLKVYGSLYMTPSAHDARRNHLSRSYCDANCIAERKSGIILYGNDTFSQNRSKLCSRKSINDCRGSLVIKQSTHLYPASHLASDPIRFHEIVQIS